MARYSYDENFLFGVEYELINCFNSVINLRFNNRLYCVFAPHVKKAPFTLVCHEPADFAKYKQTVLQDHKLLIPNLFAAQTTNCLLTKANYVPNLALLNVFLNHNQPRLTILDYHLLNQINRQVPFVELLGLGMGLTPSGDDYLVGYMAAYYGFIHPTGVSIPTWCQELVAVAKGKTNEISYNYIKNASYQLFKQEILDVISDLHNPTYLQNLLAFGYSSGYFVLLGIRNCLQHHQKRGNSA